MSDARYPIGKYNFPETISDREREAFLRQIEEAPSKLQVAVAGLNAEQLDTPYREGGWTVRQVVHHLADSHMNAFLRFKLALTELEPLVKTYDQKLWAELPDAKVAPIEPSLKLFEGLHKRFAELLASMSVDDFARAMKHPEQGIVTLARYLGLYAWHGRHHVAQITALRERRGWK